MGRWFRKLLVLIALSLIPASALAVGPNYNFIEAGYIDLDVDDVDVGEIIDSGDGWFLGLALGSPRWHFIGEYQSEDLDGDMGGSFERTTWWAGLGWHGLLGEKGDLVADVAYIDTEVEIIGGKNKDDGYRAAAGVRYLPVRIFEVNGFFNYTDLDTAGSDESWEVNALLSLGQFAIGAGWEQFEDTQNLRAFIRLNLARGG